MLISGQNALISTVLQDAGYYTGLMGKWHMGQQPEHHPNNRGFDDYWGFLGGGHNYFGPYESVTDYRNPPEHNGVNGTNLTSSDYMTDENGTRHPLLTVDNYVRRGGTAIAEAWEAVETILKDTVVVKTANPDPSETTESK